MRWVRRIQGSSFVVGLALGVAVGWVGQWLVYVDWRPIVEPLEQEQLVIRADGKGDGRFGAPRSGNRRHRGVDIEAPLGSAVRAINSGVVIESGKHRGLGRYLELEHRHRVRSLYGHLATVSVDVGERVRQGQVIAAVGKTGNARHPLIKPHLHLEIVRDGEPIDPASLGLVLVAPGDHAEHADANGGD